MPNDDLSRLLRGDHRRPGEGYKDLGVSKLARALSVRPQLYGKWCVPCGGIWFGLAGEAQCPSCGGRASGRGAIQKVPEP
ncbi:MAG: hypothetical protein ACFB9M_15540 [Myxococcota bacterium]